MAKRRGKRLVQKGLFGPIPEPESATSTALVLAEYAGQPIRMLTVDGEPWWVALDVCRILELEDVRQVMERLDDDEKARVGEMPSGIPTIKGLRFETYLVNEAGLYNLIFTSRKEEAKTFRRWVTHEVLPSIRRTGRYVPESARLKKYARRIGTNDVTTLKNRMDLVNRHKEVNRSLAGSGFTPRDFQQFHNTKYREWTGKTASELRADMGLKSHETPLDRMSDLVMIHSNHALELARKIAQFREEERRSPLSPDEQAEIYAESIRDIREADLNKLGAHYDLIDDARRGRILDVVRALPA